MTRVGLIFIADRINVYLRFGRAAHEEVVDMARRCVTFAPGSTFCRLRWGGAAYGTTLWNLSVLQAPPDGESSQKIEGIVPGAMILAQANGAPAVQALLRVIDAIEALGVDPADVSPSYWRMLNNRRIARVDAAEFGVDRKRAALAARLVS